MYRKCLAIVLVVIMMMPDGVMAWAPVPPPPPFFEPNLKDEPIHIQLGSVYLAIPEKYFAYRQSRDGERVTYAQYILSQAHEIQFNVGFPKIAPVAAYAEQFRQKYKDFFIDDTRDSSGLRAYVPAPKVELQAFLRQETERKKRYDEEVRQYEERYPSGVAFSSPRPPPPFPFRTRPQPRGKLVAELMNDVLRVKIINRSIVEQFCSQPVVDKKLDKHALCKSYAAILKNNGRAFVAEQRLSDRQKSDAQSYYSTDDVIEETFKVTDDLYVQYLLPKKEEAHREQIQSRLRELVSSFIVLGR